MFSHFLNPRPHIRFLVETVFEVARSLRGNRKRKPIRTSERHVPGLDTLEDRLAPAGLMAGGPSITSQPVSQTISSNHQATMSVTAAGNSLTYQWYAAAENTFYANQVVSYVQGTLPNATYNTPSAGLGGLSPVAGSFGTTNYYLTPFDAAFTPANIVEVGAGGSLVLKLAQTAATNGYTIGVHTGVGLSDGSYPSGTNTSPATYFNSWVRQADVMVSADGENWGDLGTTTFNNPSNYYAGSATDPEGLSPEWAPRRTPASRSLDR